MGCWWGGCDLMKNGVATVATLMMIIFPYQHILKYYISLTPLQFAYNYKFNALMRNIIPINPLQLYFKLENAH